MNAIVWMLHSSSVLTYMRSAIHAVGDGAPWIANQVQALFGDQATYLLDFYHLSEYLAAVSTLCAPTHPDTWLEQQQQHLKHNRWQQVLVALRPKLEPVTTADEHAPVRAAYRYIENCPNQLDYQGAIAISPNSCSLIQIPEPDKLFNNI